MSDQQINKSVNGSAQVLEFPIARHSPRKADARRIVSLCNAGEITLEEMHCWLKNGGHL